MKITIAFLVTMMLLVIWRCGKPNLSKGGGGEDVSIPRSVSGLASARAIGLNGIRKTSPELTYDLKLADTLGTTWERVIAMWATIQPDSNQPCVFTALDNVVTPLRGKNINVLLQIMSTPTWARPTGAPSDWNGSFYPPRIDAPADSARFSNFMKALVMHYYPMGVKNYEIWNEPNLSFYFRPNPDAVKFIKLLRAAKKGAQAAMRSLGIPSDDFRIISGGLTPGDNQTGTVWAPAFLMQMYIADPRARDYFDAVGYHPYCHPHLPTVKNQWNGWNKMDSLRAIMDMKENIGYSKLIWLTEFGAPTDGSQYFVSESKQDSIIKIAFQIYDTTKGVGPLFIHMRADKTPKIPKTNEDYFGLIRVNGSHKPAFDTLQRLIPTLHAN